MRKKSLFFYFTEITSQYMGNICPDFKSELDPARYITVLILQIC